MGARDLPDAHGDVVAAVVVLCDSACSAGGTRLGAVVCVFIMCPATHSIVCAFVQT